MVALNPTGNLYQWGLWCSAKALYRVFTGPVTARMVQAVASVCWLETQFGQGWRSPPHARDVRNNFGADQCVKHWKEFSKVVGEGPMPDLSNHPIPSAVPGCCALVVDSNPPKVKGGKRQWYYGPYSVSSDPVSGFEKIARILNRMGALDLQTSDEISRRMYAKGYYKGVHAEAEENIADHLRAFQRSLRQICAGAGMVMAIDSQNYLVEEPADWIGDPPAIDDETTLTARVACMVDEMADTARSEAIEERNRLIDARA